MSTLFELKNIQHGYQNRLVLDIQSAEFEEKKSYAILGENGSGKTTLLNLIALLTPLQNGELIYSEQTVSADNLLTLRQSIAYVQQKPFLFNLPVFENIELPLKIRRIDKANRKQLTQKVIEQLSIESLSKRNAKQLSGGELQKVAIARALVTDPKVLILDEPFSHLDKAAKKDIENVLLELRGDAQSTLIFSIHDELKAYLLADDVLTLIDGRLLNANVMNLFSGNINSNQTEFDTGKIRIHLPEKASPGNHIAIDAKQLVLSSQQLVSSMRNEFQGKLLSLNDHQGQIRLSIDAGELFQCIITHDALRELDIHPGDTVWVYFKSSIVKIV